MLAYFYAPLLVCGWGIENVVHEFMIHSILKQLFLLKKFLIRVYACDEGIISNSDYVVNDMPIIKTHYH